MGSSSMMDDIDRLLKANITITKKQWRKVWGLIFLRDAKLKEVELYMEWTQDLKEDKGARAMAEQRQNEAEEIDNRLREYLKSMI